jgi:hypothetical protein
MLKKVGIFLNNTDSDVKVKINFHNYNILKTNFDNIIIIDSENDFSKKLKELIDDNDIIKKYILDNKYIKDSINDFNISNFSYVHNIIQNNSDIFMSVKYITFVNDNYIYLSDLKDYFDYTFLHNDLNLCSYSDSTENEYHCQLYLFTITSQNIDKLNDINKITNKMPYLKIAYLNDNKFINIFYNNKIYEDLLNNNLLPIININKLYHSKNNFNYNETNNYILSINIRNELNKYDLLTFFDVPDNFNAIKYKELNNDLNHLDPKSLILHWLNYGRNENRLWHN